MSLDPREYPRLHVRNPGVANLCSEQYVQLASQLGSLNKAGPVPGGVYYTQTEDGFIAVCRVSRLSPEGKLWLRRLCLDAGWHDVEFSDYVNGYEVLEHQVALAYYNKELEGS